MLSLLLAYQAMGQSKWISWTSASLNLGLTKKLDLGINHLRSYRLDQTPDNNFNQWGIRTKYDFSKRFSARIGFLLTEIPSDGVFTNRVWLRGTHSTRLLKSIIWSNSLKAELHSANQKLYNYRFIYITRLAARKRFEFLRLSPSVSYWLYYNMGGNSIQFYDESGSPLGKETPDGLHRGRFIFNLNSKIQKHLSLSLYYLNQHEFNVSGNNINVINPTTGKIARPFNNYQVLGLSVAATFDLYKKKRSSKSKNLSEE